LTEIDLGPGSWIVLAKATVRDNSSEGEDIQFRLIATGSKGVEQDESWVRVQNLGMATVSLMLGVHFGAQDGKVQLRTFVQPAGQSYDVRNIVITALKTKKLLLGNLNAR
jgi:hypothetical protein